MATNIVKSADHQSLITDHDQTFSGNLREKVLARFRDLTLMPDQRPLLRKDLLLFFRKNLRRNEKSLRKGLRSGRETLGRLLKRGCFGDRRHVAMLARPRCT